MMMMMMAQPQTTQQLLLHGVIEATILEADLSVTIDSQLQRPTKKSFMEKLRSWLCCFKGQQQQQPGNAIRLRTDDKVYTTVDIDKARAARTRMVPAVRSPKWDESFRIYCAHDASNIIFTVNATGAGASTLIGRAYLPTEGAVAAGQMVDRWLLIIRDENQRRQPLESEGGGDKIRVQLRFTDVAADPAAGWGTGIGSAAYGGVPYTYFEQRRGCRVRLYADTHVAGSFAPRVRLAGGGLYEHRRCWEDVFDAINRARRLVYIAGWSVNTNVVLVRDPSASSSSAAESLGDLLKRKANEGVTVLMLVWDDRSSAGLGPLRRDGMMATHGQDTASFFRGTRVQCVLCPRNPMFTHHQKTVVVDSGGRPAPAPTRLVSFLGGIDLCDGRYDTQEHPLFRTLTTTHSEDFRQPNFPGASLSKGGPREPWHDVHCRVEGPAAWDVLENFEQRWKKQGNGGDHLLVALDKAWAEHEAIPRRDPESWNVQVFRSIDGGAALAPALEEQVTERSIQDAYIHAIRRARDFIYIESQYFLGSSYAWRQNDGDGGGGVTVEDINALHLIPRELSLKIASKIQAGERFAVYVVLPLWPEGVPESGSVQAILDWQRRTMEMMYRDVLLAIRAKGLRANPRDYLTFYCLGNREAPTAGEYLPPEHPDPDTDYGRAQHAGRFMIHVHAKTMIVDDEYIIVGSANINQRSMDGGRDTEIAMGAYQPEYLAAGRNRPARGQVHGFRVSLWQEHLGEAAAVAVGDDLLRPSSLECVRGMNRAANQHWDMFASDTAVQGDLPGHLMAYPVRVVDDGKVVVVAATEFFPDTKAKVLGTKSDVLPPILTT